MTDAQELVGDAPERIWIDHTYLDSPRTALVCNLGTAQKDRALSSDTEYVRADLLSDEIEAHAETQAALRAFIADLDKANARVAELEALVAYIAGTNTDHVLVALAGNPNVIAKVVERARAALGEKPE